MPSNDPFFAYDLGDDTTPDPFRSGATAAEMTGVQSNAVGDLATFLTGLMTNMTMIVGFFIAFSILRRRYPLVYAGNVVAKDVPFDPSDSFFGWFSASLALNMDEIVHYAGLDQALLIEFSHLGMKLLTTLMIPLLFVMGPVHWIYGGNRSGNDHLSKLGLANVVDNHPYLYWVHSALVWYVVIAVQRSMYTGMGGFMARRKAWLMAMPAPRATSILVQSIPDEYATDEKLKAYFNNVLDGDVVQSVFVIRHTAALVELVNAKVSSDLSLEEAEFKERKTRIRPEFMDYMGATHDSILYYKKLRDEAEQAITTERKRIQDAARQGAPDVHTRNAFVTFKKRRDSELALKVVYTPDESEFVCDLPPDPVDVIYSDLQKDYLQESFMMVVGYCAIAGVFWSYMPFILGIAYVARIDNLATHSGFFQKLADDPNASAVWNAMMGSLAMQLFVSFVPTLFVCIFSNFFVLRAQAWLQHRIQTWYFWFQVVYVLLVTAVGSSILLTLNQIIEQPFYVFQLLATTMPVATHFYLNFLPLQWVTHAQNTLRMVQLFKFFAYKGTYEEDQAKVLSEPEDQDYSGIGSRCARHSFMLALTLVFCSLTPLINLLGFINFFVCRLVYGYLTTFAESRKPDLGGVFWVTNLMNIQRCMPIYIFLMSGVLCFRSDAYGPCIISGASFVFWYFSYCRFEGAFRWHSLSLEDLTKDTAAGGKRVSSRETYEQPELCEN